jgi:Spy/CpxP family protein refolding chaperone
MRLKNSMTRWANGLMWLGLLFTVSACAPYYYEEPPSATSTSGDALHNIERFARDLDLTREQLQKIRQLRANFDREAIRINAALRVAYLDLNSLTHPERKPIDKDKVFKKLDEIDGLHAQLQRKLIESELQVVDLLTNEQYQKFDDIFKGRRGEY